MDLLASEIDRLSRAAEFWNAWKVYLLVPTIILSVLTFVVQGLALRRSRELATAQSQLAAEKDRQLRAELTEKGEKIASANEVASEARERSTRLEQELILAKTAQQRVEIELGKQRERTAIAEGSLLELQQKAAPRTLTEAHREAVIAYLRAHARVRGAPRARLVVNCLGPTNEPCNLARQIVEAFEKGGWTPVEFNQGMETSGFGEGLFITGGDSDQVGLVHSALRRADIEAKFNVPEGMTQEVVVLFVGLKEGK